MKNKFRLIKDFALKAIILSFILALNQNTVFGQEMHGVVAPPKYAGGNKALKEFIDRNLILPDTVKKTGISGTVTVGFVIDKYGKVENVRLLRGIHAVCDSEAIRVTWLLKGWQPAMNFEKPIRSNILMPIEFRFDNKYNIEQPFSISGSITEESTGKPIEGALIIIKGTNIGTISDADGKYRLEIPGENYDLEISSSGYVTKTEQIENNRTINVELRMKYLVINFNLLH
jgi:TonB family protein